MSLQLLHIPARFVQYTRWEIYTVSRFCKDVYINKFFPCTGKLLNSFSEECFPLTYDLNGLSLELISPYYLWALSN